MSETPDERPLPSRPSTGGPPPTGSAADEHVGSAPPPADAGGPSVAPDGPQGPTPGRKDRPREESLTSFLKELPVLLLIAFGLAFLLRTFVVQVFFIPSESMLPTLQVDDRIVVEKITYLFDGPDRGDVVVFAGDEGFPTQSESGVQRVVRGVGQFLGVVPVDARDLVKRVIGLPGDTVVLEDGRVSVNGVELDEAYAMLDADNGEYTVPEGELFVLGDNRDNSADSRSSLGTVDMDNVVGRAVLKIWPVDRFGGIESSDYPAIPDREPQGAPDGAPSPAPLGAIPVMGFVAGRRPRPVMKG